MSHNNLLIFILLFCLKGFSQSTFKCTNDSTAFIECNEVKITSLFFVNQEKGFAAGSWGRFFITNDGGEHWTDKSVVDHKILKIESIVFIDSLIWFLVGGPSIIYKTIDGGENWIKVYDNNSLKKVPISWFNNVKFINDNVGFAFGRYDIILKTTNQGETWHKIKMNQKDFALSEISNYTNPSLAATSNGICEVDLFNKKDCLVFNFLYETNYDIRALQFLDNQNGWAVG